jgi:hypothetical protein
VLSLTGWPGVFRPRGHWIAALAGLALGVICGLVSYCVNQDNDVVVAVCTALKITGYESGTVPSELELAPSAGAGATPHDGWVLIDTAIAIGLTDADYWAVATAAGSSADPAALRDAVGSRRVPDSDVIEVTVVVDKSFGGAVAVAVALGVTDRLLSNMEELGGPSSAHVEVVVQKVASGCTGAAPAHCVGGGSGRRT